MNTRLYLDVDGVINAWYAHLRWPEDSIENQIAQVGRGNYKIIWSRDMIAELSSLNLDLHWATTWQGAANETLAPMIEFGADSPVIRPPRGEEVSFPSIFWKFESIQADQEVNPGPFVWIDDEITITHMHWAKENGGLAIAPVADYGITPDILATIKEYLATV
ncbi:MAG: hypothetical protein ACRC5T_10730 [Cetobacterium sp.]